MNLLIHDLNEKEWAEISSEYEGWEVISDNGTINPCAGCFGCWFKTPGQCVIKDGYDHTANLIKDADEIVIMSRYTYGGFSSFVKNVLDRSIGYILPFFRIYKGEMHHKPRYKQMKPFSFVFRGQGLTDEEKAKATKYAKAVSINFNAKIKEIRFTECKELEESGVAAEKDNNLNIAGFEEGKILFVNCSLRGENSNSSSFLNVIESNISGEVEKIGLVSYAKKTEELKKVVLSAEKIVFAIPLYVDGIPSYVLRLMEDLEKAKAGSGRKIYVIANMGFYESKQLENLLSMFKDWCKKSGFDYYGGIAIGAGGMMGNIMHYGSNGPGKYVYDSLVMAAGAISKSERFDDVYTKCYKFPRFLYFLSATTGMKRTGKNNGLSMSEINSK